MNSAAPHLKGTDIYFVLFISGILGFFFGSQAGACWQNAVEGAQVIAGLVRYPPENPFYLYQIKVWTLLHQIPALGLKAGLSEKALSIGLSGMMGMLSLQALAMLTFCFSGRRWTSILASCFISHASIYVFGSVYPVSLMGSITTYGIIGMSWMMLTFALLSTEEKILSGLMLGLAPAVHPALGIFLWIIYAAALALEPRRAIERMKNSQIFLCAGLILTAISFGAYQSLVQRLFPAGFSVDRDLFLSFVKHWDGHRVPIPLNSEDTCFNLLVMLTAWIWLKFYANDLWPESRFLLRIFFAASLLGMSAMVFTWQPVENMPAWLVTMMPGRILSIVIYGLGPFLIGMADRYRGNRSADLFLTGFLLIIMAAVRVFHIDFKWLLCMVLASPVLFLGLKLKNKIRLTETASSERLHSFFQFIIFLTMSLSLVAHCLHAFYRSHNSYATFRDRTNDKFFAEIAKQQNTQLLLAPDVGSIQLLTRRPVVIDVGAMDGMVYVPEAGAATKKIMKDIYGVDLMKHQNAEVVHQDLWEARSEEEWINLAGQYQFTEILTDPSWSLKLPLVMKNDLYALYRIKSSKTE